MKYYTNFQNLNLKWLNNKGEYPLIASLLPKELKKKFIDSVELSHKKIYSEILNNNFKNSNVKDCDYVILPFKLFVDNHEPFINESFSNGKKIIIFYNDDDDRTIEIPEKVGYLIRTSGYRSKNNSNILGLPTFSPDGFRGIYSNKPHLSFCGCPFTHPFREKVVNYLKDNEISDFILRNDFLAKGIDPNISWREFIKNLEKNIYGLCLRGAGNFSYRLGETFMMGRIPVLLDTDCILPFDGQIDYNKQCVLVKENEYKNIPDKIREHYENHTREELLNIQKENRKIWSEYFTPSGFCYSFNYLMKTLTNDKPI